MCIFITECIGLGMYPYERTKFIGGGGGLRLFSRTPNLTHRKYLADSRNRLQIYLASADDTFSRERKPLNLYADRMVSDLVVLRLD